MIRQPPAAGSSSAAAGQEDGPRATPSSFPEGKRAHPGRLDRARRCPGIRPVRPGLTRLSCRRISRKPASLSVGDETVVRLRSGLGDRLSVSLPPAGVGAMPCHASSGTQMPRLVVSTRGRRRPGTGEDPRDVETGWGCPADADHVRGRPTYCATYTGGSVLYEDDSANVQFAWLLLVCCLAVCHLMGSCPSIPLFVPNLLCPWCT